MSLVTGLFSPVPLLWNCDRHCSAFKFQPVTLSVLCVMVRVQLPVVLYLLSVVSVWFSNFSSEILLLFRVLQLLPYYHKFLFHIGCVSVNISFNSQCYFRIVHCRYLHSFTQTSVSLEILCIYLLALVKGTNSYLALNMLCIHSVHKNFKTNKPLFGKMFCFVLLSNSAFCNCHVLSISMSFLYVFNYSMWPIWINIIIIIIIINAAALCYALLLQMYFFEQFGPVCFS